VAGRLNGFLSGIGRRVRPKLTVNIGITGHRACLLPDAVVEALEPALEEVFEALREAAHSIRPRRVFRRSIHLRLHTPLASGADQMAAKSAHASGYRVRALLPFAADEYRNDFAAGLELDEFDSALRDAHEVDAIAGERADEVGAYVSVGKAVVDAADILVAVWDGGEGNGPGGTADVVGLALANGLPVIHIAIDRDDETVTIRLLTGGEADAPIVHPLADSEAYCALLKDALPARRARRSTAARGTGRKRAFAPPA
jgi:hypothetical protein